MLRCLLLVLLATLASAVVKPIVDGGTNSAAALNNGRPFYSFVGTIIETERMASSNGKSLNLNEYGAPDSGLIIPGKLNLLGNDGSLAGPFLQTYTSADNHALLQFNPYTHGAISLNLDAYWNGSTISSHSGSNFQIKQAGSGLQFNYGSGNAQGSSFTPTNAFSIGTTGTTAFNKPISLPTSGGTPSDLNYYQEYSAAFPVTCGTTILQLTMKFTRIGNIVSMETPGVYMVPSSDSCSVTANYTTLPNPFKPIANLTWPIGLTQYNFNNNFQNPGCETSNHASTISMGYGSFNANTLILTVTSTNGGPAYYKRAVSYPDFYYECGGRTMYTTVEYVVS